MTSCCRGINGEGAFRRPHIPCPRCRSQFSFLAPFPLLISNLFISQVLVSRYAMPIDPTFGSFGDFLSIAILIKEICVALNQSRGSAKNFQGLLQQLKILGTSIQALERFYLSPQHAAAFDSDSAAALQIVKQIREYLKEFHGRLRRYTPILCTGGSTNAWRSAGRKLQFRLEEGEFDKFLARIMGYNTLLEIFLGLTTL